MLSKLIEIPSVGAGNALASTGDGVESAPVVVVGTLRLVIGNLELVRIGVQSGDFRVGECVGPKEEVAKKFAFHCGTGGAVGVPRRHIVAIVELHKVVAVDAQGL